MNRKPVRREPEHKGWSLKARAIVRGSGELSRMGKEAVMAEARTKGELAWLCRVGKGVRRPRGSLEAAVGSLGSGSGALDSWLEALGWLGSNGDGDGTSYRCEWGRVLEPGTPGSLHRADCDTRHPVSR